MRPKFYDFMEMFQNNITVDCVASPLICWDPKSESKKEALRKMVHNRIDLLPVKKNGEIFECITKEEHIDNIKINQILSDSTPLIQLLNIFSENIEKIFFIVKENRIYGIVTKADLQKGPFCLLIFGIITNFEIMCYDLIKQNYNSNWEEKLGEERIREINRLYQIKIKVDEDIDKLYCTTLRDKLKLILKISDFNLILQELDFSKNKIDKLLNRLNRLRNNLAHARAINSEFKKWNDVIKTIQEIDLLTSKIKDFLS